MTIGPFRSNVTIASFLRIFNTHNGVSTPWYRGTGHDLYTLAAFYDPVAEISCLNFIYDFQNSGRIFNIPGSDGVSVHCGFIKRRNIDIRANVFGQDLSEGIF